jgi:hypothetical protein
LGAFLCSVVQPLDVEEDHANIEGSSKQHKDQHREE